jgi:uncharacterized membrane protein
MTNIISRPNLKFSSKVGVIWDKAILALFIIVVGVMLALLSVQQYRGYNDGMNDLGNMSQSIWSATKGLPLEFTYNNGQLSRLGLHVELIYFVISPLYALFPDPITLLILQSFLFALGAIPVYRIAKRYLKDAKYSLAMVLIYLLYPLAQTAVLFDFHGDTLAMPLLLFALCFLVENHWKSYYLFIVLALSCKFYVALPVFMIGLIVLIKYGKQSSEFKKIGILTVILSIVWGVFTFVILRPIFSPEAGVNLESASSIVGYVHYYFSEVINNLRISWVPRFGVLLLLLMPVIWLSLHSSVWLLPAAITAFPALLSNNIQYVYIFHHYALTVPFLIFAAINGASNLQDKWKLSSRSSLFSNPRSMIILSLGLTLVFNARLVSTPLNPSFWFGNPGQGTNQLRYGRTPRDGLKDILLKKFVPPSIPIAVSWPLAPHLTNRQFLYVLGDFDQPMHRIDMVIADGLFDFAIPFSEGYTSSVIHDVPYIRNYLNSQDFSLIYIQDGLLIFTRGNQTEKLEQNIEIKPLEPKVNIAHVFNEKIGLVDSSIEKVRTGVYRFRFSWKLNQNLQDIAPLFAISKLVDPANNNEVGNFRILHIPTEALLPTNEWRLDELVVETFDVPIPPDLVSGNYQIKTSWYTSDNLYSAQTGSPGRFGDEWTWGNILIK